MALTEDQREAQRAYSRVYREQNREAIAAQRRAYRAQNRDAKRAYQRAWYEKNRESVLDQKREYYDKNREAIMAQQKVYRENNREAIMAQQKGYREQNPDKLRDKHARRRAKIARPGQDTRKYVEVLLGDPCVYCGAPTEHIDHIEPLAKGGAHEWDNLTSACAACNISKGAKPLLTAMLDSLPSEVT